MELTEIRAYLERNMECNGCVWYYYEPDTNWSECRHEDYDIENPDHCPGEYAIEDAILAMNTLGEMGLTAMRNMKSTQREEYQWSNREG